jgi:hypothetical protein
MADVKTTAILTIAHIGRASQTECFAHALLSPTYREKDYAFWAIADAADERALPAVLHYLQKNMRGIRKKLLNPRTDRGKTLATCAARYLLKYRQNNRTASAVLRELAGVSADVAAMVLPEPLA